jgi:cytochrome c
MWQCTGAHKFLKGQFGLVEREVCSRGCATFELKPSMATETTSLRRGINMFKLIKPALAAALAMAFLAANAQTVDEAKALQEAALTAIKSKGLEEAAKEFNAGGAWRKGSLYLAVAQFDGLMIAHSANDKVAGKNMLDIKDVDGKPFVKDAIAAVKASGTAQMQLRWGNPVTKQVADATFIARRIPGKDAFVGSMVFK